MSEEISVSYPSAAQVLKRGLDTFLSKDMKAWSELCDPNVVVEFPFAPDGSPSKIDGREAIYEYLRNYPSIIDIKEITAYKIYGTDDPNTAIADWSVNGRVISNGNPYIMSYATFATVRNGLIVKYKEYWNAMAFLKALSGASFVDDSNI
jgi:ketosteroid isomerase-like protein